MSKKNYVIQAKVWLWPGEAGWHFVTLPDVISQEIRQNYPKGFVKIRACVGDSVWDTSLFPHKPLGHKNKQFVYLLSIKKNIRTKESIFVGDIVKLSITIL